MIRKIASSQIITFSEAFQVKWHKPFDFPTRISSFPMYMVSRLAPLVACNNTLKSLICLGFQNGKKVVWIIVYFALMLPVMLPQAEVMDWSCSVSTWAAGRWTRLWWQDKLWWAAGAVMFHLTQPWYPCFLGRVRWRRTGHWLPQTQIFA